MIDKLFLEHEGLPHLLDFTVHLVNFLGWMSQGGYSEPLLLLALFYQRTPLCLKVMGVWWGGVGGPCDFSVSPSPYGLDFGFGLDKILIILILFKLHLILSFVPDCC